MMALLNKFSKKYVLLGLTFCLYALTQNLADPDLFARLAVGKLWITGGKPTTDPFSFLETHALWIDHEWLSGILFYVLKNLGSVFGIKSYKILTLLVILFFLLKAQQSKALRTSIPWCVICFSPTLYLWQSNVRSQLFTYMLFAIILYLCEKIEHEKVFKIIPNIWILAFFIIAVNMHGGFVIPLFFFLAFTFKNILLNRDIERSNNKSLLLFWVLMCAATLLNPYFIDYWWFLLKALTMDRPTIGEWAPLSINSFFSIYILSILFFIMLFSKSKRFDKIFFITGFALAGFSSGRLVAFFFMYALVNFSDAWDRALSLFSDLTKLPLRFLQNSGITAYLSVLTYYLLVLSPDVIKNINALDYSAYPVNILSRAKHCLQSGKMLTDFNSGSYALWVLYPKFKTGIDGRYEEVFTQETFNLVVDAYGGNGPNKQEQALMKINPDYILYKGDPSSQATLLKKMGFSIILSDSDYVIFSKETRESICGESQAPENII